MKTLLVVAHAPSPNTQSMVKSLLKGIQHPDIGAVRCRVLSPFKAHAQDVLAADALILMTPENLGYMSGALKDFLDRIFYPCQEKTQAMPYALLVRAGHDGTGTCRAVTSICGGMRWKSVQPPLICQGDWQSTFESECETLGRTLAAGLDAGLY